MARTLLFTGFPGFIGRRIIVKLLEQDPSTQITCLVQSKFLAQARAEADRIATRAGIAAAKLAIETGDITQPKLGLADAAYAALTARVNEVWHLAAVYDLAVSEELARKVNVEGTRNVLAFCDACASFDRLVYFSTCYVAGTRTGVVKEEELVEGQSFKNHYEATKFAAEVIVRAAMDKGSKAIIIRPSIVVGDSRTGETDKFDGPYNSFKFLWKLKALPLPMPLVGPSQAEVNVVPVDFLVDATVAIAKKPESVGKTFQLADPKPLKAAELYDLSCKLVTGRGASHVSLPAFLVESSLEVSAVRQFFGVPRQVLVYFNHPSRFDTTNTLEALRDTEVKVPQVREYYPTLYRYWLAHKDEAGYEAKV